MDTLHTLPDPSPAVSRSFNRVAHQYDQYAILESEVGSRLIARMECFRATPTRILDLGGGTGIFSKQLQDRYPLADIFNLDLSEKMLAHSLYFSSQEATQHRTHIHPVCANAESLPFSENQFDFVFSNCVFHWIMDIPSLFTEIHRVLKPEGLFLFSTLGPDSLKELRSAFENIDSYNHVNYFLDMHHIGDALLRAAFSDPVVDMEMITFTYPNVLTLLQDIKCSGSSYVFQDKCVGLRSKQMFKPLEEAYRKFLYRGGEYPVTVEVIYGHAFGTVEKNSKNFADHTTQDVYRIPIANIR